MKVDVVSPAVGRLEPARLGAVADTLAAAAVASLPWSTTATGVLIALWLIVLIPTLDIDAVDPAYAPGTGTPEVGGFTSREMLQLVRGLAGLRIVGADLVEVCPPFDHGNITAVLAANLVFEMLSVMALARGDHNS